MFGEVVRTVLVTLLYAGKLQLSSRNNAARELINSKQLDDKFPLELVFLFARHVRTPAPSSNLCRKASNLTAQRN